MWTCVRISNTRFECTGSSGYTAEVTLDGTTVTYVPMLTTGTLTGGNVIDWDAGDSWTKPEQGNYNIVNNNRMVII